MANNIRLKIKSYDYQLLDRTTTQIVQLLKPTGVNIVGPMPLPTKIKKFTVLRSPHVDKKARDQFEQRTYTRLIDINDTNAKVMDNLMKLEVSSGVNVKMQLK